MSRLMALLTTQLPSKGGRNQRKNVVGLQPKFRWSNIRVRSACRCLVRRRSQNFFFFFHIINNDYWLWCWAWS